MFRRRVRNAAPAMMPSPQSIHNHSQPSRAGTIFALWIVVIGTLIFLWFALAFVIGAAGAKNPQQELANAVLFGLGVAAIVGLVALLFRLFANQVIDAALEWRRMGLEAEQIRLETVQQLPPQSAGRMTAEDARKYQAVVTVMAKAFRGAIDETGKLYGKVQPWSRRSVGGLTLINEREPIGENSKLASFVKQWLTDNDILMSDTQVDIDTYPNLQAVRAKLESEFGPPIHFNPPDNLPPTLSSRGYDHV